MNSIPKTVHELRDNKCRAYLPVLILVTIYEGLSIHNFEHLEAANALRQSRSVSDQESKQDGAARQLYV